MSVCQPSTARPVCSGGDRGRYRPSGTRATPRSAAAGLVAVLGLLLAGCGRPEERVVLYCGQDQEFAEAILADFTACTGIKVDLKTDTEADKSVSLYQALVREADRPRCDVFWNGEVLNTVRLARQGLLRPLDHPARDPFPVSVKAADGTWTGFAARARILLVHNRVPPEERPRGLHDLTQPAWRGRVAMAKPNHGTAATHAICLFQALGRPAAERLFTELRPNVTILPGNKDVAVAVAEGRFDVGLTDTDDALVELRRGRPVTVVYPDQDGLGTLFIPNTVAVIRGSPHPAAAEQLAAFLLSPEVEARLAAGPSGQVPLNPAVTVEPPVASPAKVKAMAVDFEQAAGAWEEVQTFLRNLFAR
jgi:iron(III) transport system substrate-binding protein